MKRNLKEPKKWLLKEKRMVCKISFRKLYIAMKGNNMKVKCKEVVTYDSASPNGFAMGNMDGTERTCSRNAWKDGYCKQHHPDTIRERHRKEDEKWAIERAKSPYVKLEVAEKELAEQKTKYDLLLKDYVIELEKLRNAFNESQYSAFFCRTINEIGKKIEEIKVGELCNISENKNNGYPSCCDSDGTCSITGMKHEKED